jgi:uncharacterized protein YjhX (UPF0386 family)
VNVGLIGDRRGEDFREAGKSSDGCAVRISDVVVVFATGGNGFASGIGGGGVEKNVECGMFERAPPTVGGEYAPVAGWIRILRAYMQGGRGAKAQRRRGRLIDLECFRWKEIRKPTVRLDQVNSRAPHRSASVRSGYVWLS